MASLKPNRGTKLVRTRVCGWQSAASPQGWRAGGRWRCGVPRSRRAVLLLPAVPTQPGAPCSSRTDRYEPHKHGARQHRHTARSTAGGSGLGALLTGAGRTHRAQPSSPLRASARPRGPARPPPHLGEVDGQRDDARHIAGQQHGEGQQADGREVIHGARRRAARLSPAPLSPARLPSASPRPPQPPRAPQRPRAMAAPSA